MRNFTFASIVAVTFAQTTSMSGDTPFTTMVSAQVSCDGSIGEWLRTERNGSKHAGFYVQWITKCNDCNFDDGALIQNWLQTENQERPGTYDGMMCIANWYEESESAPTYAVNTYEAAEIALSDNNQSYNARP